MWPFGGSVTKNEGLIFYQAGSWSPSKNGKMAVSKNRDTPKWMVKIMVPNPIKMDDLGGPPLFLETSKSSQNGPFNSVLGIRNLPSFVDLKQALYLVACCFHCSWK